MSNNNMPIEEDDRWADHHYSSLIDQARESEVESYFKLQEDYQSLVDHTMDLNLKIKQINNYCTKEKKDLLGQQFHGSHYRDGELDCMISQLNKVLRILSS